MTGALACQPVTARQLQWNWTPAGQVALQPCPIGANGLARWYCADTPAGPVWQGTSPDMSDCKSLAITTLEGKNNYISSKKFFEMVDILFPKVRK
jgi:latrophilin 1